MNTRMLVFLGGVDEIVCNSPSLPLAYIVLFGLSLTVIKMRLLGRSFHTLIKNVSFSSLTNVGSHNHPLRGQRPRWHSFLSPDLGPEGGGL